jgi:phosphate starvation-inducible PhoH-like protein
LIELVLPNYKPRKLVCGGDHDDNLRRFSERMNVAIHRKEETIFFKGPPEKAEQARFVIQYLYQQAILGSITNQKDLDDAFFSVTSHSVRELDYSAGILIKNRLIKPRSAHQVAFLTAIKDKNIIFGSGPAGTGKTYLAVAYGLSLLLNGQIKKMIITRPILEAGEKLGFLPGDMREKIDPYLRPIYDILYDILSVEKTEKKIQSGEIELAPLAFMRGRTLSDAFVLLDEAQNTTSGQMKMFLTRIGQNSKMVITGDVAQSDLPDGITCGLKEAIDILKTVSNVGIIEFDNADIVRHPLIGKILHAYEHKPSH